MKIEMSLGSKHLVIEPETAFEEEIMQKYFPENTAATVSKAGSLRIKWSGPVGDKEETE